MQQSDPPEASPQRGIPIRLVLFLVLIGVLSFGWLFLLGYLRTDSGPVSTPQSATVTPDLESRITTLESRIATLETQLGEIERDLGEAQLAPP